MVEGGIPAQQQIPYGNDRKKGNSNGKSKKRFETSDEL